MSQVDVRLDGTDYCMSSVMKLDSLEVMGLKEGNQVNVVAKAINISLTRPKTAPREALTEAVSPPAHSSC